MEYTDVRGIVNAANFRAEELGLNDIQVSHNLNADNSIYQSMGDGSPVNFAIGTPAIAIARKTPGGGVSKEKMKIWLLEGETRASIQHKIDAFLRELSRSWGRPRK